MSRAITSSVGVQATNRTSDVAVVQGLLNKTRIWMKLPQIEVDGLIGNETIGAIQHVQKVFFGWTDGRVDASGQTLAKLNLVEDTLSAPVKKTTKMRGKYAMQMAEDGAIFVRPGDWLSKYSLILHNDFWHVNEYARMGPKGLEPVKNVNRILAAETLYHVPTYRKYMDWGPIPDILPPVTEKQKKEFTEEFLKAELKLKGKYMPEWLNKLLDVADYAENGLTLLEIAGLIGETVLGTALEIAAPFLLAFQATVDFAEVSDTDLRMYGMLAVAYATVAWSYDKPTPAGSPTIMGNWRASGVYPQPKLDKAASYWREVCEKTVEQLPLYANQKGVTVKAWKLTLRSMGGSPAGLGQVILKGFTNDWKDSHTAVRNVWEGTFCQLRFPE